jgi:hypothetical protein
LNVAVLSWLASWWLVSDQWPPQLVWELAFWSRREHSKRGPEISWPTRSEIELSAGFLREYNLASRVIFSVEQSPRRICVQTFSDFPKKLTLLNSSQLLEQFSSLDPTVDDHHPPVKIWPDRGCRNLSQS